MTSRDNASFYTAAKNNPEVLEKRKQRIAELDASIQRMQSNNPGRIPDWDTQRIMHMDLFALQYGKRCIMWDDTGPGFYLMINWDWTTNMPSEPPSPSTSHSPGWWINAKEILTPPLLDATVMKEDLAAWLDANTMRIHHKLLENLHAIKSGSSAISESREESPAYILDPGISEYGAQLLTLNRKHLGS